MTLKAWRITWSRIPAEVGIYFAATRGRAVALAVRSIEEAGWRPRWAEIRCTRAPEYDAHAPENGRPAQGRTEDYFRQDANERLLAEAPRLGLPLARGTQLTSRAV